jgi:transposase
LRVAEHSDMIQVTPQMRILVAVEPADFRKGIDGLAGVCREVLRQDPFSGYVFVFGNRRRQAIKILVYDGQGFWLCQKRLSKGRFPWWPQSNSATTALEAHQLGVLLSGGDPAGAKGLPAWRRVDRGP